MTQNRWMGLHLFNRVAAALAEGGVAAAVMATAMMVQRRAALAATSIFAAIRRLLALRATVAWSVLMPTFQELTRIELSLCSCFGHGA